MQPRYEVADVLHCLGTKIEDIDLNTWQLRTLKAIKVCRTAALGVILMPAMRVEM